MGVGFDACVRGQECVCLMNQYLDDVGRLTTSQELRKKRSID